MRRIIKLLVVICTMISILFSYSGVVFAADDCGDQNDYSQEKDFFIFCEPSGERIDSNGYFTFSFGYAMSSSLFRPTSSTITIYISATSTNSNQDYTVSVYKEDDSFVCSQPLKANGNAQSFQVSGLNTSSRYYLYFSKPITSGNVISGSGHISNIVV